MVVKRPPTYTVEPLITKALTKLFALGFQFVATPVVPSSAARRLRAMFPLIEFAPLKFPPTYTVEPLIAIV